MKYDFEHHMSSSMQLYDWFLHFTDLRLKPVDV